MLCVVERGEERAGGGEGKVVLVGIEGGGGEVAED